MRNLSVVVAFIVALAFWLWKQNAALHAELKSLEIQQSGLSDTALNHSEPDHVDSTVQTSQIALSSIEETVLELSRYGMGDITKEASIGNRIFELKEDQLPEVLELLTSEHSIGTSTSSLGTSTLQALFEHWSRLNVKESKRAADTLNGDSKTIALRGIVMRLIDTDLDAAIELASTPVIKSKLPGFGFSSIGADMLYGPVISAIAKRDPQKAADFVLNEGPFDGSFNHTGPPSCIVTGIWAESDPLAALEWARQHVNLELRSRAVFGIHMVWAQRDRSSAIDSVLSLEENDGQEYSSDYSLEYSLGRLIHGWAQQDKEAALAYLTNGLPESHRSAALFERVGSGFSRASLDSVLSAAQSIDDVDFREGFLSQVAMKQGEYDGNALELASHLREGPLKDRVFESVVKNWVQFDLEAASNWLGSIQESPSRDVAVQALTSKLVASDPKGAIEWATSITDSAQREKSIGSLAEEWQKKDRESAAQWIKQTSFLTQTTKERLLP